MRRPVGADDLISGARWASALRGRGALRWLVALLPVALALALQWALWDLIAPLVWFMFYPAIFVSSWIGGRWCSLAATVISVALVWWFFMPPTQSFAKGPGDLFSTVAFCGMGVVFGQFHERLRRTNETSRAMVARALDCIVSVDDRGRVIEWNPAAARTFGYGPDEAIGREMAELIIPEPLRSHHRAGLDNYLRTGHGRILGKRIEMPAVTKDGSEITVELSVTRVDVGSSPRFTGFLRDITARKRGERERARQADAQRLLDQATVALASSLDLSETIPKAARLAVPGLADWCIVDLVDVDEQLHQAAAAHVDPEQEELARRVGRDLDATARYGAHQVFASGEPELHPAPGGPDALGTDHPAHMRSLGVGAYLCVPIAARRRTLGVLELLRAGPAQPYDASDLAVAEELARRVGLAVDNARLFGDAQAAIAARDEFLQIASHELKTPLTPLQMQLDTLPRALATAGIHDARLVAKVDAARRQTARLGRLVESLLDVSRITAGRLDLELQRCDLSTLVRDVADRLRAEATHAGSPITVSADAAIVGDWDPSMVEQIVSNLLSNAIKYGGAKPIDVEVRASDDTVRVSITDRGIGIEAEALQRIFGRFERGVSLRHYGGLGLGLFIARQLAEAHGGTIWARSRPGEGSTFTLVLPHTQQARRGIVARKNEEAKS